MWYVVEPRKSKLRRLIMGDEEVETYTITLTSIKDPEVHH